MVLIPAMARQIENNLTYHFVYTHNKLAGRTESRVSLTWTSLPAEAPNKHFPATETKQVKSTGNWIPAGGGRPTLTPDRWALQPVNRSPLSPDSEDP